MFLLCNQYKAQRVLQHQPTPSKAVESQYLFNTMQFYMLDKVDSMISFSLININDIKLNVCKFPYKLILGNLMILFICKLKEI